MNPKAIIESVKTAARPVIFAVKSRLPEILLGAGIVSGAAAIFLTAKESQKVPDILKEWDESKKTLWECSDISEDDRFKELRKVKIKIAGKMAKNFAPAAAASIISVGCNMGAFGLIKKENMQLIARNVAISEMYAAYRTRVANRIGEEQENDIFYGISRDTIEIGEETTKNGKIKKIKDEVKIFDDIPRDRWDRFIDDTNPYWGTLWKKDPLLNLAQITSIENEACDKLESRDILFLGEVLEKCGIDIKREDKDIWKWGWDETDLRYPNGDLKVHPVNLNVKDGFRNLEERIEPCFLISPNCHLLKKWGE